MREIGHFIGGKEIKGASGRSGDVFNPNTGEVQAKVALASKSEVEKAIADAEAAQPGWAATNPQRRARVMFKFLELIAKENDSLAKLLSSEHGKVLADAKGDIQRGVEVVEFACGIPHLLKGEYSESAGPGIDLYSMRQPLGVVAGITPFNFPAMRTRRGSNLATESMVAATSAAMTLWHRLPMFGLASIATAAERQTEATRMRMKSSICARRAASSISGSAASQRPYRML